MEQGNMTTNMVTLEALTLYKPDPIPPEYAGINALFLRTPDGADWYRAQIHFAPDTRKIAFSADGVVRCQHKDVARLWPIDLSVTEVSEESLPAGFPDSGLAPRGYVYQDGKVTHSPTFYVDEATTRRNAEMKVTSARITVLVEAQDDGDITPQEDTELTALRGYRTALRRLDLSTAPYIDWPVKPTV